MGWMGWMDGSPGGPRYRAPTVLIRMHKTRSAGDKAEEKDETHSED